MAEGFKIELFASEPHVVDPVEMAFDEHGGVYVAELADNPEDPPSGEDPESRIKFLEDTDGDGVVDRHTVFADRLLAVEGLAPWMGGLIVTAAPDILFLKDTDGDRRADIRKKLYTGFALVNVEGRLSNPRLGVDNWFYVVNHGSPGRIVSHSRPFDPPVNVRNREFRFHPLRDLAEASTGDAQFGQDYNQWGHWFITHNTVHLRHTVIPPGYLTRNPLLAVADAEQDISDHGRPAAPVFGVSQPQAWRIERTEVRRRRYAETRPGREEQLEGYFTAAAGSTVYLGDSFPARFAGSVFVGEGNGNLVHCDLLTPAGTTYSAARWPRDSEFLASTDNWFRPVNLSNGPDGNLYVIDYYREILETPVSIPEAVKKRLKMDFRAGDTLGRIYRVIPDTPRIQRGLALPGALSSEDLVGVLNHPNGWHRRTAHRLLVERQDRGVAGHLRELFRGTARPESRLHALWALEGIGELGRGLVELALDDPHPAIRESALRLAEAFGADFADRILRMTRDRNPRVAFQAVLSAGDHPLAGRSASALADALSRFPDDKWFRIAVLSAPPAAAVQVFSLLAERHPEFFGTRTRERTDYVRAVGRVVGARRSQQEIRQYLSLVAREQPLADARWKEASLDGLASGLSLKEGQQIPPEAGGDSLTLLLDHPSVDVQDSAALVARFVALSARLEQARAVGMDPSAPPRSRVNALRILRGGKYRNVAAAAESALAEALDPSVQIAAVQTLASFDNPQSARNLLAAWPTASAIVRDAIASNLIRRETHALALIEAIEDGRIRPDELPSVTRIRLTQHPSDRVRLPAESAFGLVTRDREDAIRNNLPALSLPGNLGRGRDAFERECANCHLSGSARGRIGPDLSGVSNRSKEDLLTSILDPNYAIEDRYRNYFVTTTDDRFFDGILVAESAATVTLRGETKDISVLKADIAEMRQSSVSLMPEGLEEGLGRQGLADVIAYLQAGL